LPRRRQQEPEIESEGGSIATVIARHPRETVGLVMATAATLAIFINALFLQRGPHPAPIFASRPLVHPVRKIALPPARVAPPPARVTPAPPQAAAPHQDRGQLVAVIQKELGRKGFYDGPVDGLWGAKTDAAVRAFEQAAGMKRAAQPSDDLLRAIKTSTVQAKTSAAPARPNDPIAKLLAPSNGGAPATAAATPTAQVRAVQRTLAEFGYGQIKPTGVVDADTRTAIEKFERQHGLPVTGRYSERLVHALSAMTGHALE
jgi:peptidoglycan hydrolase-like protein with peptidoglycan-binding domain